MKTNNSLGEALGIFVVAGMLISGCGPSGEELFRQAQEAENKKN